MRKSLTAATHAYAYIVQKYTSYRTAHTVVSFLHNHNPSLATLAASHPAQQHPARAHSAALQALTCVVSKFHLIFVNVIHEQMAQRRQAALQKQTRKRHSRADTHTHTPTQKSLLLIIHQSHNSYIHTTHPLRHTKHTLSFHPVAVYTTNTNCEQPLTTFCEFRTLRTGHVRIPRWPLPGFLSLDIRTRHTHTQAQLFPVARQRVKILLLNTCGTRSG